ncbi:MAG TPA: HEAT repeat domain-containing protein [Tepidisphaeraceae bacterium]|nr:HEAT repeat domain-containing protein [Tepidisphaeraceae bacterium]
MRKSLLLAMIGCGGLLCGCVQQAAPEQNVGLVDPGSYAADVRDDTIRLEGEDKAPPIQLDSGPIYLFPFTLTGYVFNVTIIAPFNWVYRNFNGDNPSRAARAALDSSSADSRRWGIFRLGDESYFRQGAAERKLLAYDASTDSDFTVRAAAIRVLNRARARGHTDLFLAALHDDEPLVRLEAVKALANIPDPAAEPDLVNTLQDENEDTDVRIAAADALRCYRTEDAAHALIAVLNDDDFSVAWQARQSLILMTAHDFRYDESAWLDYFTGTGQPFVLMPG